MIFDHDANDLRAELKQCQEELAAAHVRQEPLAEELSEERFRRQTLERLVEKLTDDLARWLSSHDPDTKPSARLRRLVKRRRAAHREERRQARAIADSGFFSNSWYLTHYPDVLDSGLAPAVHYVRVGARKGYNPSADFNTRGYLKAHPKVAKAGKNPLLHYIERSGAHAYDA